MSGPYQTHLRCDEKIAAEVERFRQERCAEFGALVTRPTGLGKALYPPKVYVPSSAFLRRLRSAG